MYYLNCFFIYSILGYLLETTVAFLTKTNFKSGFLYGFWTPVYGIGALIVLFISNYLFKNLHMNRFIETLIVFIVSAIVLSFIEVLGGIMLEKVFHKVYWDYSNHYFNIGHYISLEMTIVWGIASVIFIYLINPILKKIIMKVPHWTTIVFIILFIADLLKTFIDKKISK